MSDFSSIIADMFGYNVTWDACVAQYEDYVHQDPACFLRHVHNSSSVCTNPICTKHDGVIVFVPGVEILRQTANDPPPSLDITEEQKQALVSIAQNLITVKVVSEHLREEVAISMPAEDVRDLVNRLQEAVAYVDLMKSEREGADAR